MDAFGFDIKLAVYQSSKLAIYQPKMNCSSEENCKESCPGGIAAAVVVSFLVGAITGVAILVLIYIHRIKGLCFRTKYQTDSAVSENTKVDIKFMVQKAPSKICAKRENMVGSGPVIGEISKDESQYEDLSSDVTQTRTYDVFKHAIVTEGCLGVLGNDSTDPNYLNEDLYDRFRDSNVSHAYWVLENQNVGNSQPITKVETQTTYETVEIVNFTSGFPISTTKFQPSNGSSQEISVSCDKSVKERTSHEYFILEARTDAKSTDTSMDLCSRKETAQRLNHERYSLDSQNEVENSMTGRKESESRGSKGHLYHVLEAQKNEKAETVSTSEWRHCTNMNKQTAKSTTPWLFYSSINRKCPI